MGRVQHRIGYFDQPSVGFGIRLPHTAWANKGKQLTEIRGRDNYVGVNIFGLFGMAQLLCSSCLLVCLIAFSSNIELAFMAGTWLHCRLDYHIVLIEINMWRAVWTYECIANWILKIAAAHLHNCILWRLPSDNSKNGAPRKQAGDDRAVTTIVSRPPLCCDQGINLSSFQWKTLIMKARMRKQFVVVCSREFLQCV